VEQGDDLTLASIIQDHIGEIERFFLPTISRKEQPEPLVIVTSKKSIDLKQLSVLEEQF